MHTYCMYTYYRVLKLQFNVSFVTSMTNSMQFFFFMITNYLLVLYNNELFIIYTININIYHLIHNPSPRFYK